MIASDRSFIYGITLCKNISRISWGTPGSITTAHESFSIIAPGAVPHELYSVHDPCGS